MVAVVVIEFSGMRCQPLRRALAILLNRAYVNVIAYIGCVL
ncbi:acetyltransferase [Vibrio cholerae]|nr:acetyltransferase [Vibrio cholerae]